jgi:predicted TIM-barrel fold metal-dependent hydrolase
MPAQLDGVARELLEELDAIPLVDHHVHGALRATPTRAAYGDALNEVDTDPLPPTTDPFDSQLGFAIRAWCAPMLDLERHAPADLYWARREQLTEGEVNRRFLTAAGVSHWLVDTGYKPAELLGPANMAAASGGRALEVVRLESLAEEVAASGTEPTRYAAEFRELLTRRTQRVAAVKSILAYRAGFDADLSRPSDGEVTVRAAEWLWTGGTRLTDPRLIAFGIHEAAALGLPIQLHVGLGDRDMNLRNADPLLLTDLLTELARSPATASVPVLLLHCYPFERQAGYLAQGFRNVYIDVGLAVNHLGARSRSLVARSLELAPFDKVLYSSDACGPAELHYLGARLSRNALARVLAQFVEDDEWSLVDARRVMRMTGRDNAIRVYNALAGE